MHLYCLLHINVQKLTLLLQRIFHFYLMSLDELGQQLYSCEVNALTCRI